MICEKKKNQKEKPGEQNLIIFRFNSTIQRISEAPWKIITDFVWETAGS